jgi:hypothetical protein
MSDDIFAALCVGVKFDKRNNKPAAHNAVLNTTAAEKGVLPKRSRDFVPLTQSANQIHCYITHVHSAAGA